jgi:prepilin-type N-terminal cleavage/methylation domain-containing protein
MSEIDSYLAELRSHLSDLAPRRADEIIAEVRTHIEARAAQFERTGLSAPEAVDVAVRSFGDPAKLSRGLARANARHRILSPLRAFLAPALVGGAMVALVGADAPWDRGYTAWLADNTPLIRAEAHNLVLALALVPAALLAGIIAGRRWWWLAGLPPFLWGVLFWAISLVEFSIGSQGSPRETFAALIAWPIGGGALLGGIGFVGARLGEVAWLRRITAGACAAAVVVVMLFGLATSAHDAVGVWGGVASVEAAGGLVGLAALLGSRRARRQTLPIAAVLWALCVIGLLETAHNPNYGLYVANWIGLALVQLVLAAGVYWHYRSTGAAVSRRAAAQRGFTLMELIVALVIVGILAAITLPLYARSRGRARETVCLSNLKQLVTAIQMYAAEHNNALLPAPYNRVPGCESPPPKDDQGHPLVQDAVDLAMEASHV